MYVIVCLEFKLAYYYSAVHYFNHYTTRTSPILTNIFSEFFLVVFPKTYFPTLFIPFIVFRENRRLTFVLWALAPRTDICNRISTKIYLEYSTKINCTFIIEGFRTIVFIFIVISTTFRPICHPAFKYLSNSGTFTELRTTSFIESTRVTCSDSVSHNRVQFEFI